MLCTKKEKSVANMRFKNVFLETLILFSRTEHEKIHFVMKLCTYVYNILTRVVYDFLSDFFKCFSVYFKLTQSVAYEVGSQICSPVVKVNRNTNNNNNKDGPGTIDSP